MVRGRVSVLSLAMLLAGIRWIFPERPMTYSGPRALLDSAFALGLLVLILLLAGGLGLKVQRWLNLKGLTCLERAVFGLPIGWGILAYGVLALALIGQLRLWAILLWIVIAGIWSWQEWGQIVTGLPGWLAAQSRLWRGFGLEKRVLLLIAGLILILTLTLALAPPWDYDGIMYHLQAPRLFLEAKRVLILPNIWQANGPFTIQMLYALGLVGGSDSFAKLIHLSSAVLLVLSTFTFGQRHLKPSGGWIAAAILLGIPILPIWAGSAYADIAWALYEFLALYALVFWTTSNQRGFVTLSGLVAGFGLGSKYLALGIAGMLGLWVLWHSRLQGWRAVLSNGIRFGVTAIVVGSPWYVKNWLLSGNPVYPLFFGGVGWSRERLDFLTTFLYSFGTGHSLLDYLFLPWSVYFQRSVFVTFIGGLEWPSLLFILAIFYPLTRRSSVMTIVALLTGLWFLWWATGSQQIRFLLPLFPGLSLLATKVLLDLTSHPVVQKWKRVLIVGLVGGTIVTALVILLIFVFVNLRAFAVLSGVESKADFLHRAVDNYSALQFVQENLPTSSRVLMMWDGRGYYCDDRCLPDTEQSSWTRLAALSSFDLSSISDSLRARGVTHLLLSSMDANFILTHHDPTGQQRLALEFFLQEFRPVCTQEIYQDEHMVLFELTCP